MCSVQLGVDAGDHVLINIEDRLDDTDDWLNSTVSVVAGEFRGTVSAMLMTIDFALFRRRIELLHRTLDGSALFETIEHQLHIECIGNGMGRIQIKGTIADGVIEGTQLTFEFDSDQTFLPPIIRQLKKIEAAFPNKKKYKDFSI